MAALARRRWWSTPLAGPLALAAAIAALAAEPCRAEPEAGSDEAGATPALPGPLLAPAAASRTFLRVEVEYPQDCAVIADLI